MGVIRKKIIVAALCCVMSVIALQAQPRGEQPTLPEGIPPHIAGRVSYLRSYVTGTWTYEYALVGRVAELQPYQFENASNSQKVVSRNEREILMRNTATLTPIDSKIPWPLGQTYAGAQWQETLSMDGLSPATIQFLRQKADSLTAGSTTQLEAVERIVTFLRANVNYRLGTSPDPQKVIETGAAYCEGYANAAMYLLRAAGIPARDLSCYIPKGKGWGFSNAGGYHAFVEVAYADAGWMCSDPQDTINFADPYHLVNMPYGLSAMGIRVENRDEKRATFQLYREPFGAMSYYSFDIRISRKQYNALGMTSRTFRLEAPLPLDGFSVSLIGSGGYLFEERTLVDNGRCTVHFAAANPPQKIAVAEGGLRDTVPLPADGSTVRLFADKVILELRNADKPVPAVEFLRVTGSGETQTVSSLGITDAAGRLAFAPGNDPSQLLARKSGNTLEYLAPGQAGAGAYLKFDLAGNVDWLQALARARRQRQTGATLCALTSEKITRAAGRVLLNDGKALPANLANGVLRWMPAADPGSPFALELNSGSMLLRRSLRDEPQPLHAVFEFDLAAAKMTDLTAAGNVWLPGVDGFSMQPVRPDAEKKLRLLLDCAYGFGLARDASDLQSAPGREFSVDDFIATCVKIAGQCRFNTKYALAGTVSDTEGKPLPGAVLQIFGGARMLTFKTSARGTLLSFLPRGDKPQHAVWKKDGVCIVSPALDQSAVATLRLDTAAGRAAVIHCTRPARQALYVFLPDGTVAGAVTDNAGVLRLEAPSALIVSRTHSAEQGLSVTPGAGITLP